MNGSIRQTLPFIGLLFTVIVVYSEDSFYFGQFSSRIGCGLLSEVAESCPTLCDSMDYSLPDSFVHGIFQARILEWLAISFSKRSSQPRD